MCSPNLTVEKVLEDEAGCGKAERESSFNVPLFNRFTLLFASPDDHIKNTAFKVPPHSTPSPPPNNQALALRSSSSIHSISSSFIPLLKFQVILYSGSNHVFLRRRCRCEQSESESRKCGCTEEG